MSVQALTAYILAGLVHARVIKGHAAGLNEAVGSDGLGPLISAIFPKGKMRTSDTRIAALMLVLPLFLAAIHQASLGDCAFRPLDTAVPSAEVADAFVRAYWRSVRVAASDRGAYPVPTDVNGGHSTFNEATPTWRIYWGEMARSERLELPTF